MTILCVVSVILDNYKQDIILTVTQKVRRAFPTCHEKPFTFNDKH